MKHLLKRLLSAFATAALLSIALIAAMPATQASAETPTQPATAFTAQQCAGTTPSNPTVTRGVVPNLTYVFGQRLTDYNSGRTAILYGNSGSQGGTPNCAVRHENGQAVTEWMYCTDHDSKVCSVTDKQGRLTQDSALVGSLELLDGNQRLTTEQEKLIAYIVRNDLQVKPDFYLTGGAVKASNDDMNTRSARQNLVWCVSEQDKNSPTGLGAGFGAEFVANWCAENFGQAARAKALASFPSEPELEISAANETTPVGESARVTVTTNLVNQPLQVASAGVSLELCADVENARYEGTVLTVGSEVPATRDVALCATSSDAGMASVAVEALASDGDDIEWHQSAGTAKVLCQIYAHTDPGALTAVFDDAEFAFVPVATLPVAGSPIVDAPAVDTPAADAPDTDAGDEEIGSDEPGVAVPVVDVPVIDDDESAVDAPAVDVPAVEVPGSDVPATDQPASDSEGDEAAAEDDGDEAIVDAITKEVDDDPAPVVSHDGSETNDDRPAGSGATAGAAAGVDTLSATGGAGTIAMTAAAALLLLAGATALVLSRRKAGVAV